MFSKERNKSNRERMADINSLILVYCQCTWGTARTNRPSREMLC